MLDGKTAIVTAAHAASARDRQALHRGGARVVIADIDEAPASRKPRHSERGALVRTDVGAAAIAQRGAEPAAFLTISDIL